MRKQVAVMVLTCCSQDHRATSALVPGAAISGAAEMFFSIFWTAYIPFAIVIASARRRSLKETMRQIHLHEWLRRSTLGQSLRLSPMAAKCYARLRR